MLQAGGHNTAPNRQKGVEVRTKVTTGAPKIRELFIEELAGIHGGAPASGGPYTTMACCEEGPFGCCDLIPDIIEPRP
jgi:hypothetical protein